MKEKHPVLKHKWSKGQKIADKITSFLGSWISIILLIFFLSLWLITNIYWLIEKFDPYPFIFLNLVLAIINAILAPIILMSQKRQAEKGAIKAQYEFELNKKSEKKIEEIQKQLDRIERKIK